ncbi:hypothetical protein ABID65_006709 [Bradyrhizobium sp. S3.9.2]|uniref:hypothetical protein n=1 Tax=Bradyrhizobium sp. S3.9.2 TaxID=3156432 RepID=UPI003399121C
MKINLPSQAVPVDTDQGVDPVWYEKLQQIAEGFGRGLLLNTATTGFSYIPTCAGAPTGIPVPQSGFVPLVFDITNNKLWIYNGAWKGVVLT